MAENEVISNVKETLVESKSIPNLKVSEDFQKQFDQTMTRVKDYSEAHADDQVVNEFVARLGNLSGYSIHDGSVGKDCSGEHNGKQKNINIPFTLSPPSGTGQYHGADNELHPVSFERALIHELAHATKMDRESSMIGSLGVKKLFLLENEHNNDRHEQSKSMLPINAEKLSRFPSGALHEAGAVDIENHISKQVFHDHNPRMNVGDSDGVHTPESLKDWFNHEYVIHGKCANGTTLSKERVPDSADKHENHQGLGSTQQSSLGYGLTPEQKVDATITFIQTLPEYQREPYQKMVAEYANKNDISIHEKQPLEMQQDQSITLG